MKVVNYIKFSASGAVSGAINFLVPLLLIGNMEFNDLHNYFWAIAVISSSLFPCLILFESVAKTVADLRRVHNLPAWIFQLQLAIFIIYFLIYMSFFSYLPLLIFGCLSSVGVFVRSLIRGYGNYDYLFMVDLSASLLKIFLIILEVIRVQIISFEYVVMVLCVCEISVVLFGVFFIIQRNIRVVFADHIGNLFSLSYLMKLRGLVVPAFGSTILYNADYFWLVSVRGVVENAEAFYVFLVSKPILLVVASFCSFMVTDKVNRDYLSVFSYISLVAATPPLVLELLGVQLVFGLMYEGYLVFVFCLLLGSFVSISSYVLLYLPLVLSNAVLLAPAFGLWFYVYWGFGSSALLMSLMLAVGGAIAFSRKGVA